MGLRIGEGSDAIVVRAAPPKDHAAQLTREDVTASVHYVRFVLDGHEVDRFASDGATLFVDHPEYRAETALDSEARAALLSDLRP